MASPDSNSIRLVFIDTKIRRRYIARATFDPRREVVVCDFLCGRTRLGQMQSSKLFEEYKTPTEAFKTHLKKLLEKYHDLKHCDGSSNG